MTDHNQSAAIKFSLEETVWFRKGDEISNLISLSLEPSVTIQDLEHFVSIRGALKMYGEYKKLETVHIEREDSFSEQKFVNASEAREDGVAEFQFDFPVDITIPKSRVRNFADLDIVIDFFDYDIQDSTSLVLKTDVAVTGIESENVNVYERDDLIQEDDEKETTNLTQEDRELETKDSNQIDLIEKEQESETTNYAQNEYTFNYDKLDEIDDEREDSKPTDYEYEDVPFDFNVNNSLEEVTREESYPDLTEESTELNRIVPLNENFATEDIDEPEIFTVEASKEEERNEESNQDLN